MDRFQNVPSRRKKGTGNIKDPPFPVPIETIPRSFPFHGKLMHYTGELKEGHVIVHFTGDMDFLYKMGFFGKGTLSRSQPDFHQRQPTVQLPPDTQGHPTRLRIMKKRRYLRHRTWQTCEAGVEWTSSESDCEGEEDDGGLCREKFQEGMFDSEGTGVGSFHPRNHPFDQDNIVSTNLDSPVKSDSQTTSPSKSPSALWESKNKNLEFWESALQETGGKMVETDVWETDDNFWNMESTGSHDEVDSEKVVSKDGLANKTDLAGLGNKNECENEQCQELATETSEGDVKNMISGANSLIPVTSGDTDSGETNEKLPVSVTQDILLNSDSSTETPRSADGESNQTADTERRIGMRREDTLVQKREVIHPLCHEEPGGNLLVIEDSDIEERGTKRRKDYHYVWPAVRKMEPYCVSETLNLLLEEAFFLSYGLGCLTVQDENKAAMSLSDMWNRFCELQKSFLPKYTAYHYFRSKGWVPKSGLKFGVDFILYREGPPFYHGSYSVVVCCVQEQDFKEVPQYNDRKFTWTSLAGLGRITEHVAKVLMFCYVIIPSDMKKDYARSPRCISKIKIQLQVMQRWVSSQERDKDPDADIL